MLNLIGHITSVFPSVDSHLVLYSYLVRAKLNV